MFQLLNPLNLTLHAWNLIGLCALKDGYVTTHSVVCYDRHLPRCVGIRVGAVRPPCRRRSFAPRPKP